MRWNYLCVGVGLALMVVGCAEERISAPPASDGAMGLDLGAEAAAWTIVEQAGWSVDPAEETGIAAIAQCHGGHLPIQSFTRTVISGDIVHYDLQLQTGPGAHDLIGIHRVVRERRPLDPIHTRCAVMLQHGGGKTFTGMFLPGLLSPSTPDEFGCAVYLAQQDIDVWGIDQAWTLVPDISGDQSFMADWGLQRQIDDLATAVEIARVVRRLTGSGYRKMALLGYSSGLFTGFALLNQETQLPPGRRSISAYIPVDYDYQTDDPGEQQPWCDEIPYLDQQMAAGVYANPNLLPMFGLPALEDPEGMSQIPGFETLTNLQVALSIAAWPSTPGLPAHFAAGIFDEFGIAVGLQYTAVPTLIDFLVQCPPTYEPFPFRQDTNKVVCPDYDTPWESDLASIRVPIFYAFAAGGFSTAHEYTASLLGSDDITFHEVRLHPVGEEALDYGHLDLFIAQNAPETTWGPMASWILAHME